MLILRVCIHACRVRTNCARIRSRRIHWTSIVAAVDGGRRVHRAYAPPLGTSEPAGPGTELPTGPELPVPMLPPLEPAPAAAPDPPAPAPWARAFVENVAIASESVAPNTIVGRLLFIATYS